MTGSVQAALRHAFMAAEAVFNRAFGDRLNPLYHLGAITFFLFWVVAASGLYLYAFFRTGVPEAYSSVEALTHGQWWVGGILRSVHRYASDAMVLLMGVHMLRHYAYDRLRGFRSFSWLTGVALIWLVYISGINGYMLPWDRLAQFTIVTSFQLMDSLPGLGGTLVRNFLYPESVNDRFFSLLAFIHIGVPLLVLLLMFVHVQRVPKAATNPPRPIALGVSVMLLLLSILLPVHSQGGVADLATEVGALALDWFYLPLLPLIDDWAPSAVWGLLLGGTLLLCALPWVGRRGTQRPHQVALHPGSKQLAVRPGETLLEAGLRAGLALPYDCRNGGCGVCLCHVMAGRIDHGAYQPSALTAAMRANGKALMCCAVPLDDLVVEVDVASLEPGAAPAVSRHVGRI